MKVDEDDRDRPDSAPTIQSISAVTFATDNMARATRFYRTLGFKLRYGGEETSFTSFTVGTGSLNLIAQRRLRKSWWGRVIFYVSDVDELYQHALAQGFRPDTAPRDAEWGERYFHLTLILTAMSSASPSCWVDR